MCGIKGKPKANQGQTKGKHQDILGQPLVCLRFTLGLMQKTKGKPRLNRWQTKGKHQPLVYTWLYKNIYMYKLIIINSKPMANQVHNCAFGLPLVYIWFPNVCCRWFTVGLPLAIQKQKIYILIIVNCKPMANQVQHCAFGLPLVHIWLAYVCSRWFTVGLPLVICIENQR
jgi:hypothetical protein